MPSAGPLASWASGLSRRIADAVRAGLIERRADDKACSTHGQRAGAGRRSLTEEHGRPLIGHAPVLARQVASLPYDGHRPRRRGGRGQAKTVKRGYELGRGCEPVVSSMGMDGSWPAVGHPGSVRNAASGSPAWYWMSGPNGIIDRLWKARVAGAKLGRCTSGKPGPARPAAPRCRTYRCSCFSTR
jgi:hypothetical protein